MTGRAEVAEDLVQETVLRAWSSRKSFKGNASLETWVYRIAINNFRLYLREERKGRKPVLAEGGMDTFVGTDSPQVSHVVQKEELALMRDSVMELPSELRVPVVLRY